MSEPVGAVKAEEKIDGKPVTGFVTAFTPAVQPPMPGEKCPTCGRRSPMTAGQRKRKSRKEG